MNTLSVFKICAFRAHATSQRIRVHQTCNNNNNNNNNSNNNN